KSTLAEMSESGEYVAETEKERMIALPSSLGSLMATVMYPEGVFGRSSTIDLLRVRLPAGVVGLASGPTHEGMSSRGSMAMIASRFPELSEKYSLGSPSTTPWPGR